MTERQRQLRDFLRAHITKDGTVPSQLEMAKGIGAHPGGICWLLQKLEEYGEIERGRGHRNIKLLRT